jgi:hypothetical protein
MAQRNAWTALAKAARKPSPVVLNSRPPKLAASGSMRLVRNARARQRARLVPSDHCRIADDIGCQNTGQPAASAPLVHLRHRLLRPLPRRAAAGS